MKHRISLIRVIFTGVALLTTTAQAAAPDKPGPADTVYTNGKIYTVNEKQPWAEAVAIKDGKFIAVGSKEATNAVTGKNTKTIDLGGAFAMPGITDAHIHTPLVYINEEAGNLLMDALTADEVREKLLAYAKANPGDGWIRAEKYRLTAFPGGKTDRQFLDSISRDRPVLLYDETGHNAVANSKALEIAGITRDTPDPDGGSIERDPETGEPSGYLGETAIGLVGRHTPSFDVDVTQRAMERVFTELRALGITSFIEMIAWKEVLEAYRRIEQEGNMTFRISAALALNEYSEEFAPVEPTKAVFQGRAEYETELVKPDSFKYWADGTPFTYTSLLLEPYANRDDTLGVTTMTPKQMKYAKELLEQGHLGRFHVIGDGTSRVILDLVEEVRKANPENNRLVHHGHTFMVHPDEFDRFRELNVIAEFSPTTLYIPGGMTELVVDYIGKDRTARVSPIAELHEAGATVVIGSDWPAGTPTADPWWALEGLVTRKDPVGEYKGQLGKPVALEDAIRMMTLNGTKAMEREDEIGSIEVGKFADMVVLDQNLFEIEPDKIVETNVRLTIFGGTVVFDANRDPAPTTKMARILPPLGSFAYARLGACGHEARALRTAHQDSLLTVH